MLVGSNAISEQIAKELLQECGVIRRMLVKSITTAKENAQGQMWVLSKTRKFNLQLSGITYREKGVLYL